MANQQHLDILKRGIETWNQWRREHQDVEPDLSGADLSGANFYGADLSGSNLSGADLSGVDLNEANLYGADLGGTFLYETNLSGANLYEANLSGAKVGWTIFGNLDLRSVKGLDKLDHFAPSTVGIDTIMHSGGDILETFLRGVGLSDSFITYARSLVQHPIEYYTCFISYSSRDNDFATRLHADLQQQGVRCWFAPEDLKIGDIFWHRIDESIRIYNKLLVVLSEHSVQSDWVEREVTAALEKEKQGKTVLFPITLDDAVKDCAAPWAADIRRSRHIGDFRRWKNHDDYQKDFARLLRDLKAAS